MRTYRVKSFVFVMAEDSKEAEGIAAKSIESLPAPENTIVKAVVRPGSAILVKE